MSTLAATPAQIGTAFARQFISARGDPCFRGIDHPTDLESRCLWMLARYGNHPEFWRMAMIQLMVRARKDEDQVAGRKLWYEIATYLLNEASPAQLQDDVLWHFTTNCPLAWSNDQVRNRRRRLRQAAQKVAEPLALAA